MGKPSHARRLDASEALAIGRNLRVSPIKLNLIAHTIRGQKVGDAMTDLSFSRKRIAGAVRKVLASAIANAENNHNLDIDRLVVAQAHVGKHRVLKRWRPRARGRTAAILKPISRITIIVREQQAAQAGSAS